MGYTTMIYVLGTMTLFLTLSGNVNSFLLSQSSNAYVYYADMTTRNIGGSVVEMLTSKLSDDKTFRATSALTTTLFGGTANYRVIDTVIAMDTLIKISVDVNYYGQKRSMMSFYKPWRVPVAFTFAALSGGNFSMSGGVVLKPQVATTSINVGSNNAFSMSGGNTKVYGSVIYGSSYSGNPANIVPYPTTASSLTQLTSPVPIPTFSPATYLPIATKVYSGNYSPSGTVMLGASKTNPAIIYVGGDLTLGGGVTLNGYGIFIVNGNISMTGGTTFINTDPNVSNFAFYSVGDIKVSGGSTVYGQMLSLGNVTFSGNSSLGGTVAAAGTISMSGGTNIDIPVAAELVAPIWGKDQGVIDRFVLNTYYE